MDHIKKEIREHIVKDEVIVEHRCTCDICGHEMQKGEVYYHGYWMHSDWGNDSFESAEWFDACCTCIGKYVDKVTTEEDRNTLQFNFDMQRFFSKAMEDNQ